MTVYVITELDINSYDGFKGVLIRAVASSKDHLFGLLEFLPERDYYIAAIELDRVVSKVATLDIYQEFLKLKEMNENKEIRYWDLLAVDRTKVRIRKNNLPDEEQINLWKKDLEVL